MKGYVSEKGALMNQNWRVLLGICLAIAVCVPMVSAAIQVPTTQYSFNRPSFEQLKVVKDIPYTFGNNRIPDIKPVISDSSESNLKSLLLSDMTQFKASGSIFEELWAPCIWVPTTISYSDIYITEEEAIAIALAQYPGIILTQPISATLEYIDAADSQQATVPCWVVDIVGFDGPVSEEFTPKTVRGGTIFIDAVTGEILYRAIAICHFEEMTFKYAL